MPDQRTYHFEGIEVDLARGRLVYAGVEKHLRRKAFQVLVYLLEHRERLVTKDELFDAIWKNTSVTDDVLVQAVTEIRRAIGDEPARPRFIKTVPKAGYRFLPEVEVSTNGASRAAVKDILPVRLPAHGPYYVVAALALVALIAGGLVYLRWSGHGANDGRRSVAVFAFENRSGDADIDWLRDGLADMLLAGLSRSDKLSPMDRAQLTVLSGRSGGGDLGTARDAHADIFVEGNFSRIGERLRLDVSTRDAHTGNAIAAESLTVEHTAEILTQIDLLSLRLLNRLNAAGRDAPQLATAMTDNLEAYRYYTLGVAKAQALENSEAIEMLQRAVELDPNFAMAHARIGYTYAVSWGLTEEGKPHLERAFQLSSSLTERDRMNVSAWYAIANLDFAGAIDAYREIIKRFPLDIEAYWRLGRLLGGEERGEEAVEILRQGIALDPGSKDLFNVLGTVLSWQGKHAEAIAAHQRYVALAPSEANAYDSLGLTYQWAGEHPKALANFKLALEVNPQFEIARIHLAQCRVRQGQFRSAVEELRRYITGVHVLNEKARGYEVLSYVYRRMGDLDAAEVAAEQAASIDPKTIWMSYVVAVEKKRADKAKRIENDLLLKWSSTDRGSSGNLRFPGYFRGVIAMNGGHADDALSSFRDVLRHRPATWSYEDFEDCLGTALLTLGRYDEAIAEFERVLQLSPNYPRARFYQAEAYRAKGMAAEARQSYNRFLEEWKDADKDAAEIVTARKYVDS
jgi:tetratricopeptide (TPR) repeat protein/DNA-binding winged helix-turn-helix (wHTH) protein